MAEHAGLGDIKSRLTVYIGKVPPMGEYQSLDTIRALTQGEIRMIGQACGNGWRKVFNVYSKLLFCLDPVYFHYTREADSWQQFRDHSLLQINSHTLLMFSPPGDILSEDSLHIIMGRTYAKSLPLADELIWLDEEFAWIPGKRVIVCPYFDYRQLSNIKIQRLAGMILQFSLP